MDGEGVKKCWLWWEIFSVTTFENISPSSESLPFFPNKWCVWANAFSKWKLIPPANDVSGSPAKVLLAEETKYENHSQTRPRCTWDESFTITACTAVHFTHKHHMGAFFPLSYHSLLLTQSNNCSQHTTNILRTCPRCGPPSCLLLLSTGAPGSSCSSQRQTDTIFNNRTHT